MKKTTLIITLFALIMTANGYMANAECDFPYYPEYADGIH
jgi:hypothetical protein